MESQRSNQPTRIGQLTPPIFNPEVQPQTQQPAEGNPSTFVKNFGKFQRAGATYTWKIYRPRLDKLVGYSHPFGMAEKANKQELLLDCIRRLKDKYIREGHTIVFYRNIDDDDDNSIKIFTMYGSRYLPEPIIVTEGWLIKYLNDFYNPVVYNYNTQAGLFPTGGKSAPPDGMAIIPDSSKQAPRKDPFDLSRTFKDADALMNYIMKLYENGHPKGLVEDYYRVKIQAFYTRPV